MRETRSCRVHEPVGSDPTEVVRTRRDVRRHAFGTCSLSRSGRVRTWLSVAGAVALMTSSGWALMGTAAATAGSTWNVASAPSSPVTSNGAGQLSATVAQVACPAAGFCVAVGESATLSATSTSSPDTTTQTATSTQATGANATSTTTSTNAGTSGSTPATTVTSAGTSPTGTSAQGTAVTPTPVTPTPVTPTAVTPGGLSASQTSGTTSATPFAEVLSGGAWTTVALPLPAGAATGSLEDASLTGLSCPSTTFCVATGMYEAATGADQGLVETMSGSAWSAAAAALPVEPGAPTGHSYLEAVSCAAASACVAVGWYRDSLATYALVDELSATGWSALSLAQSATAPLDPRSYLVSVACPASGTCVAVGFANEATGGTAPLVVQIAGGQASGSLLAPPSAQLGAATTNHLQAVACAEPGTCTAVGTYRDQGGTTTALAAVFSGGGWSAVAVPLPSNTASTILVQASLDAVACSGPGSCVAGGYYHDVTGGFPALVATRSGGTWTSSAAPAPAGALGAGAADGTFAALTCSSTRCLAVGEYAGGDSHRQAVVETFSTGAWTAVSVPPPSGDGSDALVSLSCQNGGCAASGSYVAPTGSTPGLLAWQAPAP